MNQILKISRSILLLFLSAGLLGANPALQIETILDDPSHRFLGGSSLESKDIYSPQARWALEEAVKFEQDGDLEKRDRFLSIALVYLERHDFQNFSRQKEARLSLSPRAPSESGNDKKQKEIFDRLYTEQGLFDPGARKVVDGAVKASEDMESWFIAFLEKTKLLSKNYRELNDKLREKYPHLSPGQLSDYLIKNAARMTMGVGFVAALPGVFPGAGTVAQLAVNVGTMVPDIIFLFKKQATLIFRIAEIYGKDMQEEERVTEAMILFGIASGVSAATRALEQNLENKLTIYVRAKVTPDLVKRGIEKAGTLHPIIKDILVTLFQKKAITEATVEKTLVGLIPLVGAGISGGMNYMFTSKVGKIAKEFYSDSTAKNLEAMNNLRLAKVELAMFRALILTMNADGLQKPEELMILRKVMALFPHNNGLVERMLAGEDDLIAKFDYDISSESEIVKEQILYSVTAMQYVDQEKGPEEIDLHDKIIEKFKVDQKVAERVEIRVRTEKQAGGNALKSFMGRAYWTYQKMIGARQEPEF
ncbi:EcsC family protein [bacterium]|jgi:hypothetical protein|nr:EcsC family protein [bacterium]